MLALRGANRIVVETVGVGYEVLIPLSTYYRLPPTGERVALEIRQVVRADALTLYGFSTGAEKRSFDLLMSVQHVGPNSRSRFSRSLRPRNWLRRSPRATSIESTQCPALGQRSLSVSCVNSVTGSAT